MDENVDYRDRWIKNNIAYRLKTIETLECDENGVVFPHWIMGEFSETDGDVALSMGRDYFWFIEHGQVWLMLRMCMKVFRMPAALEEVILSCWYRGTDGKNMFNDYEIRTPDGELLIAGTGVRRPYDMNTVSAIPISQVCGGMTAEVPCRAPAPECGRIIYEGQPVALGSRRTVFTDLDINHHINNSVYTRIATDFLPDDYRGREMDEYYVNFVGGTELGEVLDIACIPEERGCVIVGSCENSVRFSSRFTFK